MKSGANTVTARAFLQGGRIGAQLTALRAETDRLMHLFTNAGAMVVEPEALLPADTLIDLYGEDLRARAYTTHDPVSGEQMLRPDFTVPVVQLHMEIGNEPARYAYAGQVWRKQEPGSNRPTEYLQTGFELFDGTNVAQADAEVFALMNEATAGLGLAPVTGDIGFILAAIDALDTNDRRKAALRRHVWRPYRFKRLLDRYSATGAMSTGRASALLATGDDISARPPVFGLRDQGEVDARVEILLAEAKADPIPAQQLAQLERILAVSGSMTSAINDLRGLSSRAAVDRLEARAEALRSFGIDPDILPFEVSYGRTTLEYYDGFVFGIYAPKRPDLPQVAQGGRYDALTKVLGVGRGIPAVGGIIRPEALLALRGGLS